jgi:hypothetical protein
VVLDPVGHVTHPKEPPGSFPTLDGPNVHTYIQLRSNDIGIFISRLRGTLDYISRVSYRNTHFMKQEYSI